MENTLIFSFFRTMKSVKPFSTNKFRKALINSKCELIVASRLSLKGLNTLSRPAPKLSRSYIFISCLQICASVLEIGMKSSEKVVKLLQHNAMVYLSNSDFFCCLAIMHRKPRLSSLVLSASSLSLMHLVHATHRFSFKRP